ncbi:MAG: ABC transporter ATP-binding protein [Longimicrobiales bacterium]
MTEATLEQSVEPTPVERAPAPAMVELRGLVKRYGSFTAVNSIDLTVPKGTIFGFLGPNGAGKTTTIRMLSGILKPTAGTVFVGGDNLWEHPELAKSKIGYIPDRPHVYEKLTGGEFIDFVGGLWGVGGEELQARADRFLKMFELTDWKHELVESYSHGMRQKLLITSAFVHQPELIVVDEPMVGLDPRSARLLKDLFRSYADEGGTIFLSSHTLEVVEAVCDEIAIIQNGVIAARGTLSELRSQADAGEAHLEEIFLKVTGGAEMAEIVAELTR